MLRDSAVNPDLDHWLVFGFSSDVVEDAYQAGKGAGRSWERTTLRGGLQQKGTVGEERTAITLEGKCRAGAAPVNHASEGKSDGGVETPRPLC